jgi:ABC-type enterochelin transport system permease subunit
MNALIAAAIAPTPSGFPAYTGNPDLITPGVVGFGAVLFITVATIFLLIDMNRRVRRTRYRAEVQEQLRLEAEAEAKSKQKGS